MTTEILHETNESIAEQRKCFEFELCLKSYFVGIQEKVIELAEPKRYISLVNQPIESRLHDIPILKGSADLFVLLAHHLDLIKPDILRSFSQSELHLYMETILQKMFSNKVVYFLPSRVGEVALVARDQWGANVGLVTDKRYYPGILSIIEFGRLGEKVSEISNPMGISFLARAKVEQLPELLSQSSLLSKLRTKKNIKIYDRRSPNIVISTNMLTTGRFSNHNSDHSIKGTWMDFLRKMFSLGEPGKTIFLIKPSFGGDYGPVCDETEMRDFLRTLPELLHFQFHSAITGKNNRDEYSFLAVLKEPIIYNH
jgi:hypothetical protein